ncbi:MAG: phosphodiester glycosidase family protein [Clostridia bacterium]|nr:phosphodiester glycosidase family protein [Clostridia bacterium]
MTDNIFVIIPSLNPDERLINTVEGMLDIGFKKIILVNDGSDAEHLKYFPKATENITVIHRKANHGKGAALKVAFRHILNNYPNADGVVTVDGDGQHKPSDVLACAEALDGIGKGAVLGCRDFSGEDVPRRSRMGNHITSAVFKAVCGMKISDTQTGLRAFPASLLPLLITVKGDRFEYETNMLLKFKQCGVKIKEVKIETVYLDENSSSHFRPVIDSLKIYKFILAYILSSAVSFIIDILLFYIASKLLKSSLGMATALVATVIARAVSSFVNYSINRTTVFDSKKKKRNSLIRYYILAIPQMLVSAALVSLIGALFKAAPGISTVIKVIVDTVLFFISYRIQQGWVFSEKDSAGKSVKKKKLSVKTVVGRTLLSLGTAIVMLVVTVFSAGFMVCYGPSKSLRNMLVIMAKEASATKWAPTLFLPKSKVDEIIADSEKLNTDVIDVGNYVSDETADEWKDAKNGMILNFLSEPKYKGYLLLIKDPKRVSVGISSENFASATEGMRIFDIASKYNAAAAINAGEFLDTGGQGKGSAPMGLTYSGGKNVWNDGLKRTFIGFDKNDRLICRESMSKKEADELGIRDAVSFQNGNVLIEQTGNDVKLYKADSDTGTAQRTAIGQRADGTVIMLVTDGRSVDSIGATRNDVIELMVANGAVNAAMLDGGSSAMMYYRDYYDVYSVDKSQLDQYQLQGLVNRYKAFTKPRRIPTYFIVTEEK